MFARLYRWCSNLMVPVTKSEDPPTMSDDLKESPLPFTDDFTLGLTIDDALISKILSMGAKPPTTNTVQDELEERPLNSEECSYTSQNPISDLVEKIVVEVEVSGKSFFIEKDLLCSKSTYFKTALNSGFIEAKTNKFLLDERPDIFKTFNHWLEQGNLDFMDSGDWIAPAEDALIDLVEIYSFADRRGAPDLSDQILQKIEKHIRPGGLPVRLETGIINLAWEKLPETCGLCRYLVAIEHDATKCNVPGRSGDDYECLSGDFIAALFKYAEDKFRDGWPRAMCYREQPVEIAKLRYHVRRNGGCANVDQLGMWNEICDSMGIRAPIGWDEDEDEPGDRLRRMYVWWLRPWDAEVSTDLLEMLEGGPRPLVKAFFDNATQSSTRQNSPLRPAERWILANARP